MKKFSSEQVSLDIKECAERDSNYLKEFIFKLKNVSDGIPKPIKPQLGPSSHKKTNSMTSATAKRRDLTGYYVTHKKNKEKPVTIARHTPAGSHKGYANQVEVSEARPALAGSRSHASSLLRAIEKSYRQAGLTKDISLTASIIDDGEHYKADREKKPILNVGKSTQDFKKTFAGLNKKKHSDGCGSAKFGDCRITPQLRPCLPDPLDKSASDI